MMTTPLRFNPLLTASALVYLLAGMAFIFAGEELLRGTGASGTPVEIALVQLLGAAVFGLGMLNWMNRFAQVGGIYGRPVVVANFANAFTSALMLVHVAREVPMNVPLAAGLATYALLALGFGARLFGSPVQR
ncbi:MAG: hypothetical protein ACREUZ_07145 [Burkholderiales bacterium]